MSNTNFLTKMVQNILRDAFKGKISNKILFISKRGFNFIFKILKIKTLELMELFDQNQIPYKNLQI